MFQFSLYMLRQTTLATHSEIHYIHLTCLSQWRDKRQLLKVSEQSATVPSSDHSDYGQTCWDGAPAEPRSLIVSDGRAICWLVMKRQSGQEMNFCWSQAPEMSELVVTEKSPWTQQYGRINTLTKITRINYKKSNFVYKRKYLIIWKPKNMKTKSKVAKKGRNIEMTRLAS